ncbi:hypothetical protein FHR92_003995 [Fontibacillus solani]|uniref:Uncharacterized protein n=1 Tax=Fontibacillus solani TaxID=1572857 RepID=A0A7W3SWG4_9BACL|nr:hypothetical protein [Fontibacillus solani]MBA9087510.1 hypothetical protein [Fontibacillus solani]
MFGRKKKGIRVQHYEGLKDFMQDFPCTVEMTDEQFLIQRVKPETTVNLPVERILEIDTMEEEKFMLKYHNDKSNTSKTKGIKKYYLVVRYLNTEGTEQYLAFWGTASEYGKFIELQKQKMNVASSDYSL